MRQQYDYPYVVAVSNLPWVEKYRPETLDNLISEKDIVSFFRYVGLFFIHILTSVVSNYQLLWFEMHAVK